MSRPLHRETAGRGGFRPGAGRHRKTCDCGGCEARRRRRPGRTPRVQIHGTLPPHMEEYLRLWHPANTSAQLEELIERCMRMWPAGPSTNPRMRPETLERHREQMLALRGEEVAA